MICYFDCNNSVFQRTAVTLRYTATWHCNICFTDFLMLLIVRSSLTPPGPNSFIRLQSLMLGILLLCKLGLVIGKAPGALKHGDVTWSLFCCFLDPWLAWMWPLSDPGSYKQIGQAEQQLARAGCGCGYIGSADVGGVLRKWILSSIEVLCSAVYLLTEGMRPFLTGRPAQVSCWPFVHCD